MDAQDLTYTNLLQLLKPYRGNGRQESANFLSWFLSNIYRLDSVDADDAVCDESNDKGIDGIYVDHNAQEIHFFQTKISQKVKSLGDASIKQFIGSVHQFETPEKINDILSGNANADLKRNLIRNNIADLLVKGYVVKAVFVSNSSRDDNTREVENIFPFIEVYTSSDIADNYIEFDADEGVEGSYKFDTGYAGLIELSVEGSAKVYLLPVSATSLVKLKGISDGTLFSQNVRLSLGKTAVNKAIAESVADTSEHSRFTLYHNGVTIICKKAKVDDSRDIIEIKDYVVVNGAQSITTFYHNSSKLTDDLRVFVKIISLEDDALARKITINSNNQNAIKPRDLRSNHDLMLRLKAEFDASGSGYQLEIKRGQLSDSGKTVVSNDDAGRQLLAFDLDEPYASHQIYRVFDDKYAQIFGRREVTYGRIIFLHELTSIVTDALSGINIRPMARYALTKYFMLNVIGHILRKFKEGRDFLASTDKVNSPSEREKILEISRKIIDGLVIDLNYEVDEVEDFDYKKEFKSPDSVDKWRGKLLRSYDKDFNRGKADGFGLEIS